MSKIETIKRQNPDLNVNLIDFIAQADPSETNKYLAFLIKMLKENSSNSNLHILQHIFGENNLIELKKFEEHCRADRIKNKDIGLYTSFKQISDEVKEADEIFKVKQAEKQIKVLFKDDNWLMLIPLSFESSKIYGANTKWCTTTKVHWSRYIDKYKLIYIINKSKNEKWAISVKKDLSEIQGWLSNDDEVSPLSIPIPSNLYQIIHEEIQKKETVLDLMEPEIAREYKPQNFSLFETSNNNGQTVGVGEVQIDISEFLTGLDVGEETIWGDGLDRTSEIIHRITGRRNRRNNW